MLVFCLLIMKGLWCVDSSNGPGMFDPMVTCFCDQYLVIYYWFIDISRVYKLMLFDLATKECKKVELPEGTRVATKD